MGIMTPFQTLLKELFHGLFLALCSYHPELNHLLNGLICLTFFAFLFITVRRPILTISGHLFVHPVLVSGREYH